MSKEVPVEKRGRPTEPAFSIGALHLQQPQNSDHSAYDINNRADTKPVLPPVKEAPRELSAAIRHELRGEADATRQSFFKAVKAHATARVKDQPAALLVPPAVTAANEDNLQRLQSLIDDRKTVYQGLGAAARPQASAKEPTPANEVLENFTSPGLILHQQEALLTENKFAPTRVLQAEHSRAFKEGFRRHFEAKRDAEERREHLNVAEGDKLRTNNLNSVFGAPQPSSAGQDATSAGTSSEGSLLTNPNEGDRLNKP